MEPMRPAIFGPGFDAGKFLTARLAMDRHTASDHVVARFDAFRAKVVRHLEAAPGVIAVTMSETVPFEEPGALIEVDNAGTGGSVQRNRKSVALNRVDGAFYDILHVPVLTDRRLAAGDFDRA